MNGPTFQLLLDFAKHAVWPFELREEKRMSNLVSEMRLRTDEELSHDRLVAIVQEFCRRYRPFEFDDDDARVFADFAMKVFREHGDSLPKEEVAKLRKLSLAQK
jgi:hypothetical protein